MNNKLKSYNVLIIGDIMLDRYLKGKVSRISPEAPVPILEKINIEIMPGGAANVALNIKSLGSNPLLLSIVGDDNNGEKLIDCIDENGISTGYIIKDKTRQTTVKTRIMSKGQHIMRIDEEDVETIDKNTKKQLLETFNHIVDNKKIDAVIIQDYDKGLLDDYTIHNIINTAKGKNIFISVDPKFDNFFSYKNVDLFKPNLKEVSSALNKQIAPNKDSLDKTAKELYEKLQYKNLFITLSSKGIYYSKGNNNSEIIPTKLRDVVDVSGAGDVVLSVATLFFISGYNPSEVACFSNIAGGLACGKIGVATVGKDRLIEEIKKSQNS